MAFDKDQAGMAIFLLIAAIFNFWFVVSSFLRAFSQKPGYDDIDKTTSYKLLSYAVFAMASFDFLWVWLCMIQCWNNTVNGTNSFNQNSGDDSFGCKFMGWYSSFSLVSMMGSHCLVVYYLVNYINPTSLGQTFSSGRGVAGLSLLLLVTACLFASMPLMQGGGYALTSGGFCYADFTNKAQASVILSFTLFFLVLSSALWMKIRSHFLQFWYYYVIFFCTWILWVPAASYGIANGEEITQPYMLVGAIIGHANAIINPVLYGWNLFRKINVDEGDKAVDQNSFKEAPSELA